MGAAASRQSGLWTAACAVSHLGEWQQEAQDEKRHRASHPPTALGLCVDPNHSPPAVLKCNRSLSREGRSAQWVRDFIPTSGDLWSPNVTERRTRGVKRTEGRACCGSGRARYATSIQSVREPKDDSPRLRRSQPRAPARKQNDARSIREPGSTGTSAREPETRVSCRQADPALSCPSRNDACRCGGNRQADFPHSWLSRRRAERQMPCRTRPATGWRPVSSTSTFKHCRPFEASYGR